MAEVGGEGFETLGGIGGDMHVWDEATLTDKLSDAEQAGIRNGKTYIYPLWKALLNKWFKTANAKVYLATPFLDQERLKDVCRIILSHRAEDKLAAFFVREKWGKNYISTFEKLKTNVLLDRDESYKKRFKAIFDCVRHPKKRFHAKFMCCIVGNMAKVLVTSANFEGSHFGCDNLETVHYITMTKREFEERFLQPLF